MLILGINTATKQNAVTLFSDKGVLAEKVWPARQNEAETLLPNIKDLFCVRPGADEPLNMTAEKRLRGDAPPETSSPDKKPDFQDLTGLLIVAGPGSFTSLRVGVITANALAYALNIPQHAISTFEYYRKRLPENLKSKNTKLFVSAGKQLGYFEDEKTPQTLSQINEVMTQEKTTNQNAEKPLLYGNFLPQQIEELSAQTLGEDQLLGFGEAFVSVSLDEYGAQKQIEPLYIQPPKITMSKKITG